MIYNKSKPTVKSRSTVCNKFSLYFNVCKFCVLQREKENGGKIQATSEKNTKPQDDL
jgi:hypothetical protein